MKVIKSYQTIQYFCHINYNSNAIQFELLKFT